MSAIVRIFMSLKTIQREVLIDSRDRTSGEPGEFSLNLASKLKNVVAAQFMGGSIPASFDQIDDHSDRFAFTPPAGAITPVDLVHGNYNITNLCVEISRALLAADGAHHWGVAYLDNGVWYGGCDGVSAATNNTPAGGPAILGDETNFNPTNAGVGGPYIQTPGIATDPIYYDPITAGADYYEYRIVIFECSGAPANFDLDFGVYFEYSAPIGTKSGFLNVVGFARVDLTGGSIYQSVYNYSGTGNIDTAYIICKEFSNRRQFSASSGKLNDGYAGKIPISYAMGTEAGTGGYTNFTPQPNSQIIMEFDEARQIESVEITVIANDSRGRDQLEAFHVLNFNGIDITLTFFVWEQENV